MRRATISVVWRSSGGARLAVTLVVATAGITRPLPAQSAAAERASGVVRVYRTVERIRLDGIPDEPVWLRADSVTAFTQMEPREGEPASERTVVRVLATADALIIGVWAYDREPGGVVRSALRRDADPESDDFVAVALDPTRDRRTGFVFSVNPNGQLFDGEIRNREDVNEDWNGVWDARAHVGAQGWTAELVIPWQTLRYPAAATAWGVNFYRQIRRRNEEVLWRSWRRQQGLFFLDEAGTLDGLDSLPPRRRLELRPFAIGTSLLPTREYAAGVDSVSTAATAEARAGLDAKVAVGPTLTLDLTYNTDFAQVEADRQIVNLTRFSLFFPEKRPFFLEGAGIFDFGQRERTQLFYSRRIGLSAAREAIPITVGARLSGRVGRERIGLLAARTGGEERAANLVTRVRHDLFTRGYVGAIATFRDEPGAPSNRSAGVDVEVPTLVGGQNFVMSAFHGTTWTGSGPARNAWRVFLDYPNDWADNFLSLGRVDEDFDPALGFVRETGVWRHQGAFRFFPRPRRFGIRRLLFTPIQWDVTLHVGGGMSHATYEIRPLGASFESGDQIELNLQRVTDVPDEPFDIFRDDSVPAGRYDDDRIELDVESSDGRPLSGSLQVSAGEYYGGHAEQVEGGLALRLAPHVIASADYEWTRVRLLGGRFTARAARLRLDYASTPRLNTTVFLQWDNENERLTVNARLHWIPSPGSDAYLVWNTTWPTDRSLGVPWRRPQQGGLAVKYVAYLRR